MEGVVHQLGEWKKVRGRKAKRAAADTCTQAIDAVEQSSSAFGCPP